jgi:hypothetical protein
VHDGFLQLFDHVHVAVGAQIVVFLDEQGLDVGLVRGVAGGAITRTGRSVHVRQVGLVAVAAGAEILHRRRQELRLVG